MAKKNKKDASKPKEKEEVETGFEPIAGNKPKADKESSDIDSKVDAVSVPANPVDDSGLDSPLKDKFNKGESKVENFGDDKFSKGSKKRSKRRKKPAFGKDAKVKDVTVKADDSGITLTPKINPVSGDRQRQGNSAAFGTNVRKDGVNNQSQYIEYAIRKDDLSDASVSEKNDTVMYANNLKATQKQTQIVKDQTFADANLEEVFRDNDDILADELNKGQKDDDGNSLLRLTGTVDPSPGVKAFTDVASCPIAHKIGNPYGSRGSLPDVKIIHKGYAPACRDNHSKMGSLLRKIYLALAPKKTSDPTKVGDDSAPTRSSFENISLQHSNGTVIWTDYDGNVYSIDSSRKINHWSSRENISDIPLVRLNGTDFDETDGTFVIKDRMDTANDCTPIEEPKLSQNPDTNDDYTTSPRAQKRILDVLHLWNAIYKKTAGANNSVGSRIKTPAHLAGLLNCLGEAKTIFVAIMKVIEKAERTTKAFRSVGCPNNRVEKHLITSAAVYKNILAQYGDLLSAFPGSVPVNKDIIEDILRLAKPYFNIPNLIASDPLQTLVVPVLHLFFEIGAPTQDISKANQIEQPRIDVVSVTPKTNTTPINFAYGDAFGAIIGFVQKSFDSSNTGVKWSILKNSEYVDGTAGNDTKLKVYGLKANTTNEDAKGSSVAGAISFLATAFQDNIMQIGTVVKNLFMGELNVAPGWDLIKALTDDFKGTSWTTDRKYIMDDLNINRMSGSNYRYGEDIMFEHDPDMFAKDSSRPIAEVIAKDQSSILPTKELFIRYFDNNGHRHFNLPTVVLTEPNTDNVKSIPNIKLDVYDPGYPKPNKKLAEKLKNEWVPIATLGQSAFQNVTSDHNWDNIINKFITDHNHIYVGNQSVIDKTFVLNFIIGKYVHNTRWYNEIEILIFNDGYMDELTPGFTTKLSDGAVPSDYYSTDNDYATYPDTYLVVNVKDKSSELLAGKTCNDWTDKVLTLTKGQLAGNGILASDKDLSQPTSVEATLDESKSFIFSDLRAYLDRIAVFTGETNSKVFALSILGQDGAGVKLVYNNTAYENKHLLSSSDQDMMPMLLDQSSEFAAAVDAWNTHEFIQKTSQPDVI